MKLSKTQLQCLKEINFYDEYPSCWMPKTRAKLEELGLVEGKHNLTRFMLTELGKKTLSEIAA